MFFKSNSRIARLELIGGQAKPGPALASLGINMVQFSKEFNEKSQSRQGEVVPVEIEIFPSKSFKFKIRTTPTSVLLKKIASIEKGSKASKSEKVATLSRLKIVEIAEYKLKDSNTKKLESMITMNGTVVKDTREAVEVFRKGQKSLKNDSGGNVQLSIGLTSFSLEQLEENLRYIIKLLRSKKPLSVKSQFIKQVCLSATMGGGVSLTSSLGSLFNSTISSLEGNAESIDKESSRLQEELIKSASENSILKSKNDDAHSNSQSSRIKRFDLKDQTFMSERDGKKLVDNLKSVREREEKSANSEVSNIQKTLEVSAKSTQESLKSQVKEGVDRLKKALEDIKEKNQETISKNDNASDSRQTSRTKRLDLEDQAFTAEKKGKELSSNLEKITEEEQKATDSDISRNHSELSITSQSTQKELRERVEDGVNKLKDALRKLQEENGQMIARLKQELNT
ncbi:hypothetical protein PVNG_02349 [Plasmodium vivax North Korean]|uniref:50S ribosomal protein L11 n=1 Tax=Plasmodium vivax North Korean TaxID=1035514 RepID=A0A0J9TM30_PLAVI|nr:hypothetical protein PVNG_02349 [Plasmodium vivax North Korean]